ncbi:uncharacterized protein LOC127853447 [Dreissena polymorpha]|uniref:Uncharacterized protein n=1 Tax=Dreissena polymorpha TaxID=45954 RepID=A0A9D4HSK4_DREPO|nr:uncharacterized protein LOC127853447 [Dreissena polymorpha]KAH3727903.1 hypothetical protein DPMN_053849 [Dreissena polymorpha]
MSLQTVLPQAYFFLLELIIIHVLQEAALGMFAISNQTCCNGVLGYAGPDNQMPCAEMRCCNSDEIVALQRVNHAFGFCFRCVPETSSNSNCYNDNQLVATTNESKIEYALKTCCKGLKFTVLTYFEGIALTIKCVKR